MDPFPAAPSSEAVRTPRERPASRKISTTLNGFLLNRKPGLGLGAVLFILLTVSAASALELEGFGGWEGDIHASGFAFYSFSADYPIGDPFPFWERSK